MAEISQKHSVGSNEICREADTVSSVDFDLSDVSLLQGVSIASQSWQNVTLKSFTISHMAFSSTILGQHPLSSDFSIKNVSTENIDSRSAFTTPLYSEALRVRCGLGQYGVLCGKLRPKRLLWAFVGA
jgi:hypothetical protein